MFGGSVAPRMCASILLGLAICGCWSVDWTNEPTPTLGGEFEPGPGGGPPRGDSEIPVAALEPTSLTIDSSPAYCCDPKAVHFVALMSGTAKSEGAVYEWDFGDRRTGTGPEVDHTYSWPGEYVVTLTVTLADGAEYTTEKTIAFEPDQVPDGTDAPDVEIPDENEEIEVYADAGTDLQVESGAPVVLDGRRSSGTGPGALQYEWRQLRGPVVVLENRFTVAASFVAPTIEGDPVTLTFALIVSKSGISSVDDMEVVVAIPEPTIPIPPPVRLAVTLRDGTFVRITNPGEDSTESVQHYSGTWGRAEIRRTNTLEYELSLTASQPLNQVWFPWFPTEYACNRILYPHLLGLEIDNHRLAPGVWSISDIAAYPGPMVFPGAVMEHTNVGLGVFAVNWPPLGVRVLYARGTVALRYDIPVAAGETRNYRAMIVESSRDESAEPWHRALDPYKSWLTANMVADGMHPIPYPQWLLDAHGWSNVQLEDYDDPMGEVRRRWEEWGHVFPAIQTWGSMSNRYTTPGEETGCCLIDTSLHPRNAELPSIAEEIIAGGGQFGYYARPQNTGPVAGPDVNAVANREFLLNWIDINRNQLGGNMNYLDWFIVRPLGPVLEVAHQFRDGLWGRDTVCERAVDVYPTAFFMSGALWGGPRFRTYAEQTLDQIPQGQTGIAFPRFARYVIDDRVVFMGESNGDHAMWGVTHGQDYWGERQAFLLGCKLDWMQRPDGSTPNDPAVPMIIDAWTRNNFWARSPVYLDTLGVRNVPTSADVRRFRGSAGETIIAVVTDLPNRSLSFDVDGQTRTLIPSARFDMFLLEE